MTNKWTAVQANDDWAIRTETRYIAIGRGVNAMLAAQDIADAHNDAFAAEREAHGDGVIYAEVQQLRTQLASQKDWSEHLRIQLAAEVEKVNKLQDRLEVRDD